MSFIGRNPQLTTLKFNARSSAPSSPTEGMMYYDDGTTNAEGFYKYQNSVWEPIGSNANYLKLNAQSSDPSTPVEGQIFYSNGTPRPEGLYVYDGTQWVTVGSGSGINYIDNSDFEGGTTGYSLYADTAASTPSDGTGGTATSTITASSSSPLRGLKSLVFSKPASNEQGEGFSYDFTIDSADKNNLLKISFDYDASDADYVDNDMSIFIYDVTNATLIRFNGEELKGRTNGKYIAYFQASQSTSYRLIFHVASTSALAYDVKFDNISVSPEYSVTNSERKVEKALVQGHTGYASTNTKIPNLTTLVSSTISDIATLVISNATLGNSLTIKKRCRAFISYQGTMPSATDQAGLSLNSTQLTTNIANITQADRIAYDIPASAGQNFDVNWSGILEVGDVVRIHNAGTAVSVSNYSIHLESIADNTISDASGRFHTASVTNSGTLTLTVGGGANQRVNICGTKITDTTGMVDSTNHRINILESGFYNSVTNINYANVTAGTDVYTIIYKNGAQIRASINRNTTATSVQDEIVLNSLELVKGDYLEVYSWSSDASYNVNVDDDYTNWTVTKVANPVDVVKSNETVYVEYYSSTGGTVTDSVTNINWTTKVADTHNAWSGTQFTAPITGLYSIDGDAAFTATSTGVVVGYINDLSPTVKKTLSPNDVTTRFHKMNGQFYLVKGEKLSFRLAGATRTQTTAGGDVPYHYISIIKIG